MSTHRFSHFNLFKCLPYPIEGEVRKLLCGADLPIWVKTYLNANKRHKLEGITLCFSYISYTKTVRKGRSSYMNAYIYEKRVSFEINNEYCIITFTQPQLGVSALSDNFMTEYIIALISQFCYFFTEVNICCRKCIPYLYADRGLEIAKKRVFRRLTNQACKKV